MYVGIWFQTHIVIPSILFESTGSYSPADDDAISSVDGAPDGSKKSVVPAHSPCSGEAALWKECMKSANYTQDKVNYYDEILMSLLF